MDKNKITRYINEGKEIELLEQLELLNLSEYNDQYKRLFQILIVLLNHSKKNFLPIQQLLYKTIYKVLKAILSSKDNIKDFATIIKTNSGSNYENISTFLYRFILNIKDGVEEIQKFDKGGVDLLANEFKLLNIGFLKKLVSDGEEYSSIVEVLYHCVDDLEENRRVILHPDAISVFYQYLNNNPKDYLSHFIRPYYYGPTKDSSEYYLHVSEPFCEQIFKAPNPLFDSFLDNLSSKDIDKNLIIDVQSFYTKANSNPKNTDKTVMLFSLDNRHSYNRDNHLKLLSEDHLGVRKSCKPPNYSYDDRGQFIAQ